jgi:hypothetical protein
MSSINSKALRIAKTRKPISSSYERYGKNYVWQQVTKFFNFIPLSSGTVGRRINYTIQYNTYYTCMAGNVESQLIERAKKSPYYALQIDETTDVTNDANLMCYVRYAHDSNIHDDILFCKTLPTRNTGEKIHSR